MTSWCSLAKNFKKTVRLNISQDLQIAKSQKEGRGDWRPGTRSKTRFPLWQPSHTLLRTEHAPIMTFQAMLRHKQTKAALAGALVALLGWQVGTLPLGQFFAAFSYDFPFLLSEPSLPREIVLIEMDEISHTELHQEYGRSWDRQLHAQLLDHLRREGSDLVVFDIVFADTGTNAVANEALARAMREHRRVVLAAGVDKSRSTIRVLPPNEIFRNAAHRWGPTQAELTHSDGVVRRIYPGTEQTPSLAWVAASLVNPAIATSPEAHWHQRWLCYYGPGRSLPRVSYSHATNQPAGFFRGKTVFIGGRPGTRFVTDEVDEFMTPWRLHGEPQISGLELTATSFLNLARGDFLMRPAAGVEALFIALAGIVIGVALSLQRPWRAVMAAMVGAVVVVAISLLLFFESHVWFNWSVIVVVQIPCALAWSLGWHWWQLKREKEWLESPLPDLWDDLPVDKPVKAVPAAAKPDGAPNIPDHELLRLVGRGAYGDVWLARDILGNFHAVKIVRRVSFDHAAPYEREFRGLQNITPVSRSHPGLVHILHVGRSAADDYFYYVMEAGDDEMAGTTINPESYTPRNLGRDLLRRSPLPPAECVAIMVTLCETLEFLHGRGLIHRDIKPANIIFVSGKPKLADIGLVAEVAEQRPAASQVGTEGYLPPEGPGTIAGDVFALGRVLEEMIKARNTGAPGPRDAVFEKLHAVVLTACAVNPAERYASARAMCEALAACTN